MELLKYKVDALLTRFLSLNFLGINISSSEILTSEVVLQAAKFLKAIYATTGIYVKSVK